MQDLSAVAGRAPDLSPAYPVVPNARSADWTSPLTGSKEQTGNNLEGAAEVAETIGELRAAEREVAREWQWLHDTLNEIARVRAEHGDAEAFRRMQAQAMVVGQRRIDLSVPIAQLEGPAVWN
jgi:hypothetical protein